MTSDCAAVLGSFINKAKSLWRVLGHPSNEVSSMKFITLLCYLLQLLSAHLKLFKFKVDCRIVHGNEVICPQKLQQLVQEVVRVAMDEIVNILLRKNNAGISYNL